MASYTYKRVMFRDDFQAAIGPAMEACGSNKDGFDGDAGYDGDGWTVAAFLLDQKDETIKRLLEACEFALTTPGMIKGRDAMMKAVASARGQER
ncbi:hypothetical protein ABNQ39_00415 (plasmid) [Azospirillum sp. A26]|uniref:hypothetical protein n=1 Tax=Azospirillum sp. A26 TaxID=3160607 RepID=UPI00366DEF3B